MAQPVVREKQSEPPRRKSPSAVDPFPTFEEIVERTCQLLAADGQQVERIFECWYRAEEELLERAAQKWSRKFRRG
jgi:hypothetical protein